MALPDQTFAVLGSFSFDGLDINSSRWSMETLDGWGSTGSTSAATRLPRRSGALLSDGYATERTIALTGKVYAPNAAALDASEDLLHAAVTYTDSQFTVFAPGKIRTVPARRGGEVLFAKLTPTIATWSVQLLAADWRRFGTASTYLNASGSAFTSNGNTVGLAVLKINGPRSGGITITHAPSGLALTLLSALTISTGHFVTIDVNARTVQNDTGDSLSVYIGTRNWVGFNPGANAWTLASGSGAGTLDLTLTEAWR